MESIEEYSKVLNELASQCDYSNCCRDRLLRDIFISGLQSSKIMSTLISNCEDQTFHQCVEKAKIVEQINQDVEDIKPTKVHSQNRVSPSRPNKRNGEFKQDKRTKKVPNNYVCIRCGTKAKHFASDCFAKMLKCNSCSKTGHIARVCKTKKTGTTLSNYVYPEEEDHTDYIAVNTVKPILQEYKLKEYSVADLDHEFPPLYTSRSFQINNGLFLHNKYTALQDLYGKDNKDLQEDVHHVDTPCNSKRGRHSRSLSSKVNNSFLGRRSRSLE